jgi:molybdopterin molybdotransferase
MTEFLRLMPPDEARAMLLSRMTSPLADVEILGTTQALHRVTVEEILAPHSLPEFARATVDGYALRAHDTFGASPSLPAYLKLVGEVRMGTAPRLSIATGECALIHTGGMVPAGSDAVAMLEDTQAVPIEFQAGGTTGEVEIFRVVAAGENVILPGEDVQAGQIVFRPGVRLRPQDIGGLMALGITTVRVRRKPRVALISSGDEIVDPQTRPLPGQVRDVNSASVSALLQESGAEPILFGVVPDEAARAEVVAKEAFGQSDMVILTAGSSAGARDLTSATISALGLPGVLVHGVNIRPGKPTILGVCDGKAVIGLPGNPISALVIARLFVLPAVALLLGLPSSTPRPSIKARLTVNLPSQTGREDWWPVRLEQAPSQGYEWLAVPIFSRSNLIFSLVAANGLMRVAADLNGISAGELVEVESLS